MVRSIRSRIGHCKLGPGVWIENCPGAGDLSPQGIVTFAGKTDRFDQAVGQGWFVLAVDRSSEGLLSDGHAAKLDALGGRVLSIGGQGMDVIARDSVYSDWMVSEDAHYIVLRPDFYVAATAKTPKELAAYLDEVFEKLCV